MVNATPPTETKVCCRCKRILSLDHFYPIKNHPSQYQGRCIECNKIAVMEWRKANPEQTRKHRTDSQKRCRKHVSEYHAKWTKKHGEAAGRKHCDRHLKRNYGISLDDFETMLAMQDGCCAICGREKPSDYKSKSGFFHVDHCHRTGMVRGILCFRCNVAIGHLKDNAKLVRRALEYLLGKQSKRKKSSSESTAFLFS